MLKLADSQLCKLSSGNKRKDDIGGKSLLEMCFNAESMCCVDENASVLRRNNRFDYCRKIVDIRKSLDAK